MKRSGIIAALLLFAAFFTAGCASTRNGAALMKQDSPVAFRVGSKTITVADIQARMGEEVGDRIQQLLAEGQTPEQITQIADQQNYRQDLFDRMIQEELLLQEARRQGVGVDVSAVDSTVASQAQALDFQTATADTFDNLARLRVSTVRQQIFFAMVARNTRADMFKSRHILVDDEAAADKVLADLAAGRPFAELAQERSKDTGSAIEGGELGWVPRGAFVPEFEQAAFEKPLNQPFKVQSQFGWHVIEVLERQNSRSFDTFDQLQRSPSFQMLIENSFIPWYDKLRADAEAAGDLEIAQGFSPTSVPLPFQPQP